ncbi:MAG: hypothetical protein GX774_22345 [Armatimonadetes bacterium]|nr:hypothetical protein [Armatimonadota bacterium]
MSLRINQNIGALNVHRNLMNTDNAMSKSVNRLSSGFRINGGADDPAGLVISEYLRAQVDGLGQAIANSNDAINLIKTAEGALAEVNNLLKSMRTLAVHASNTGVNSAEALAADQADIQSAIASLNRIASTTMFGDKRLLDGTSGITGTSTNGLITVTGGTAMTKAGTYSVDITAVATRASVTSSARQVQQITAGAAADNSKNTITGADFGQLQFAGDAVGGSTYNIRIYANETVQDVVDRINGDAFLSQKITAGLDAAGKLTFTTNTLNATDGSLTVQAINGQGASGTAAIVEAFTGVTAASAMTSAAVTASGSSRLAKAETLTITDVTNGNRSTSVSLQAGDSLDTVVRKINSAVIAAGVRVQASLEENAKIVFTNTAYGSAANARVTITSSITEAASTANLGIGFVDELHVASGGGGVGNYAAAIGGTDVAGTINGEDCTGVGQILTGNSGNANTAGLQLRAAVNFTGTAVASVTVNQGSLTFQVGANAGQLISQSLTSVAADQLGTTATGLVTGARSVADIDITTLDGAQDAIKILDAAIQQISTQRAQLGAFQRNVLESNINSLGIAKENLQASESSIRDADMAAEMVQFTRHNIMMQAGTAMLAQANQLPQQLLSLLR